MPTTRRTTIIYAISGALFFTSALAGDAAAQIPSTAGREAARLERLATYVWDGMIEDRRSGYTWDQKSRLDVFNFITGARHLSQKLEQGQSEPEELSEMVDLLLLQSRAVDLALRSGRAGRTLLRDWDESRASLSLLARLLTRDQEPVAGRRDVPRSRENVNDLRVEIKEIRRTGNLFSNDYRIIGVISGRNMVSAGIYHQGKLIRPVPVRLNEQRFMENPFQLRIEGPGNEVTLRVIDNRGFVLEQPIEWPAGGLLPGFK